MGRGKDRQGQWPQQRNGYSGWPQASWHTKRYGKDKQPPARRQKEQKNEGPSFLSFEEMEVANKPCPSQTRRATDAMAIGGEWDGEERPRQVRAEDGLRKTAEGRRGEGGIGRQIGGATSKR